MATIRKRTGSAGKTSYHVQVRLKGFAPETASFERLSDAREWASKIETDIRAGRHFGGAKRHTFKDLADEYETDAIKLRSFDDRKRHLKYWREAFGADLLSDVTPQRIKNEREKLLATPTRYKTRATGNEEIDAKRQMGTRSGPTVNRYLATLSACFSYGVKTLQWIERKAWSAPLKICRCSATEATTVSNDEPR